SRRRHTRSKRDWSSDVCSSDLKGISGIDTARMLRRRDKKVKIVYVTAYEDFRDYAFSVHAFGYLVKPVKRESVHEMIREVLDYKIGRASCSERVETAVLDVIVK